MAERVGFEPTKAVTPYSFSRRAHSAALTPLPPAVSPAWMIANRRTASQFRADRSCEASCTPWYGVCYRCPRPLIGARRVFAIRSEPRCPNTRRTRPISDYALIGDCHAAALVSRTGSVDWCCMPRFDSGSCFGRLLDWEHGGYCSILPTDGGHTSFRQYIGDTLVLATTFRAATGEATLYDCFAMRTGGKLEPRRQLLRIVEGVRGHLTLHLRVVPRFDYGALEPWMRHDGMQLFSAIGGNDALVIQSDAELTLVRSARTARHHHGTGRGTGAHRDHLRRPRHARP